MSSIDLDHDGTTQDPETPLLRDSKNVSKKKRQKRIFTAVALLVLAVAVALIVCYELGVFDSTVTESAVFYEMNLFTIQNETIKCNDGTTPGYYLRYSPVNNTNWVIQFPGGNCCYDNSSCGDRYLGKSHASDMTAPTDATYWGEGITSSDPSVNPNLWNWNSVEVHYCTSDYWLGTNTIGPEQEWFLPNFYFHGGLLLPYIFNELQSLHGLGHASTILFSGYSVAGLGVLSLWDRVKDQLTTLAPHAELYALSDSGWWMWNSTYDNYETSPTNKVWPLSIQNTKPLLHPDCLAVEVDQPEKCFAGDIVYPYITNKDTLLVSQQMFDKIHLNSEGFLITLSYENKTYHLNTAQRYYDTMQQVVNVFASDCRDHDLIDSTTMDIIYIMDRTDPLGTNYSLVDSIERLRRREYIHFFDECGEPDCNPTCPIVDAKEAAANGHGDFDPNNML